LGIGGWGLGIGGWGLAGMLVGDGIHHVSGACDQNQTRKTLPSVFSWVQSANFKHTI
jgi:hypothetical protein